jgi:nucleoside 2-deoxyribosyltransferase
MKITICGSIAFLEEMKTAQEELEKLGHEVLVPESLVQGNDSAFWADMKTRPEEYLKHKNERMMQHFEKVASSDAVLVVNEEKHNIPNYIGPNTLLEIGVASYLGKKIYILNNVPDQPLKEELQAMHPIILNGQYTKI